MKEKKWTTLSLPQGSIWKEQGIVVKNWVGVFGKLGISKVLLLWLIKQGLTGKRATYSHKVQKEKSLGNEAKGPDHIMLRITDSVERETIWNVKIYVINTNIV